MIEEEKPTDEERELPLTTLTVIDLTFTYPETKVPMLHDVNLTIKPGEFIGIVGGPGSGKSTLFKLLLRLHDTPQGSIYVGDEDITSMPLQVLRRSIAYVPPEPYLLGTTIGENIAFGEASDHTLELSQAAERAALTRDLSERLAPAAKRLKEGGTDLSGGQKQRVNIARGLYKNAPYLLLDDSFSALDTISAGTIINTLRQGRNQSLLFISQRLEALREADRIIVFKEGTIVEEGTHEALMAKEGEYYRLYAQQLDEPLIGVAEEGGDQ